MSKLYFLFGGAALAGGGIATTISLTTGKSQNDQVKKEEEIVKVVLGPGTPTEDGLIIEGKRDEVPPPPKSKGEK